MNTSRLTVLSFIAAPMTGALLLSSMMLLASAGGASAECGLRFEVAASSGMPVPASRATRMAEAGACEFDVRVQPTDASCAIGPLVVRGLASTTADAGWQRQRVRTRARHARRRVLRARMAGSHGAAGKARLALRCTPRPKLDGCETILAESAHCYLGGGDRVRVAGLDTGQICRGPGGDSHITGDEFRRMGEIAPALMSRDFAVFEGDAYTCAGSADGGFVATPLDGGAPRAVAGPCEATTTDGESLLVLPAPGFDAMPSAETTRRLGIRRNTQLAATESSTEIRAYAFPEAVPSGAYEVAFDLADIPPDSPCAGIHPQVLAAADGAVYAAGCRPDGSGSCAPIRGVCVLGGSTDGAFLGSAGGAFVRLLELEDFNGQIEGMSALDGGRLVVLARPTFGEPLPPVGYDDPGVTPSSAPCPDCVGVSSADLLHVFDVLTGARLDSVEISTTGATGISCEAGSS